MGIKQKKGGHFFHGHEPKGNGWKFVGFIQDDWKVFLNDWDDFYPVKIKLVKTSLSPIKANYSLAYSKNLQRLCKSKDEVIMSNYAMELKEALISLLDSKGYYCYEEDL